MAHYALLDEENIVTQVITGNDKSDENIDWEEYYSNIFNQVCKRTSYNTQGNQHLAGGTPFRMNYAGIGYTYREDLDGFIAPQPFESWSLDESTGLWNPPVPYPNDGGIYSWNESDLSWTLIFMPENIES